MNGLLSKRSALQEKISPAFTRAEIPLGKRVIFINTEGKEEVDLLFEEIKKEIKQINQHKHSNKSYENPYISVNTMDGMFLDQRK